MKRLTSRGSDSHQYVRTNSLQEDLLRLLESGEGADIKFVTSYHANELVAHSDVIIARCHAFRSSILIFLVEKQSGERAKDDVMEIQVKSTNVVALKLVLRYVYTGTISLEDEHLYDICVLSDHMGIPSLLHHVFRYLSDTEHSVAVLQVLDRALTRSEPLRAVIGRLTECLSSNCSQVLKHADLTNISLITMHHVVKQESLGAAEHEIWNALVRWACHRAGIERTFRVSQMTNEERQKLSDHIGHFCRPGLIRILNFEAKFFASEVEPLDVFSRSELLLKYRFAVTVGKFPFEVTFPKERYSFLARIRQRCMSFESERHPHPRGVYTKVKVDMPQWVSEIEVTFDERTALGRYADLEFFMDEECTARLFSLRTSQNEFSYVRSAYVTAGVVRSRVQKTPDPVHISGNRFWFTFYAPKNVGDLAWGYKFLVSVLR